MPKQRKSGERGNDTPATPGTAVPPPDDPLSRHEADPDAIDSAEAAALRAEAIRRTRMMPSDDHPPPDKK